MKIVLGCMGFGFFGVIVSVFCISMQISLLSKKINNMLKLFAAQQKILKILVEDHSFQLNRSNLEIKIDKIILENILSLLQFLEEQRNHGSNQSK